MQGITLKHLVVVVAFALIGWALCGALIGIGRTLMTLEATLIVHAIGAPLIFGGLALVYFRRFRYTTPLQTAVMFVVVVMLMDATVVAGLLERSYALFASVLGTWIPFALIFLSTYLVGWYCQAHPVQPPAGEAGRASPS